MNSITENGKTVEKGKRGKGIRKFAEIVDQVTTVIRVILTCFTVMMTVIGAAAFSHYSQTFGSSLDHLPDGSGPADGYIVLGKIFGSILAGYAGIMILVLLAILVVAGILGILLCLIYLTHRRKYRKNQNLRFLFRNLLIKILVNGLSTGFLTWMLLDSRERSVSSILIWLLAAGGEVLLITAYYQLKKVQSDVEIQYTEEPLL